MQHVCVCVCVRARARAREKRGGERERGRERGYSGPGIEKLTLEEFVSLSRHCLGENTNGPHRKTKQQQQRQHTHTQQQQQQQQFTQQFHREKERKKVSHFKSHKNLSQTFEPDTFTNSFNITDRRAVLRKMGSGGMAFISI